MGGKSMGTISGIFSVLFMVAVSSLNIGDVAPSLEGNQWLKGNAPVFRNQVTVVEFWRTTCGNCKAQIPHLTSLQKKYGNRISIVALSMEPLDKLEEFIKLNGDQMGFTVGKLSKELEDHYLAGIKSVPHAFLINRDGLIVWKGHPKEIDNILAKTVEGKIDLVQLKHIDMLEISLNDAIKTNDRANIDTIYKKLLAADPSNVLGLEIGMKMVKYNGEPAMVKELFDKIELTGLSGDKANVFAMMLLSDSDLAYRYPESAVRFVLYSMKQNPDNDSYMNTCARLFYCLGDIKKAVAWQNKALELNPKQSSYKYNLDYYLSIKAIRENNQLDLMN
jgi:thiol-disulfide isomerase/thioredoxin